MNVLNRLFGLDRKVVVYTSSNGMMGKVICHERDIAKYISDVMAISKSVNVRIEPFMAD